MLYTTGLVIAIAVIVLACLVVYLSVTDGETSDMINDTLPSGGEVPPTERAE